MLTQTIVWTAVPNGVSAGQLRLVCLASPRLANPGGPSTVELSAYPDVVNWADTARPDRLSFAVKLAGQPAVAATRVSAAPHADLWPALFPPSTVVRAFAFSDHTARNVRSYPVANVLGFLSDLYRRTALLSPTRFPLAEVLLSDLLLERIGVSERDEARLLQQLDARFGPGTRALPPGPPDPRQDFLQVKRFHQVRKAPPATAQPTPEPLDFHQVLALLMEYPAVQRLLGLAFDLTVPIPSGLPANPTVQFVPQWTPVLGATQDRTPVTTASYGLDRFLPADAGELTAGALDLSTSAFGVTGIDVDGSALKLRQTADTVNRAWRVARSGDTPDRYSLPGLRGGGVALFRTGRAVHLVSGFATAKADNTTLVGGGAPTFDSRSLLHGLRFHVYDVQSGRWFSLCRRTGEYEFLAAGATVPVGGAPGGWEEGPVSTAATGRLDGSGDDLYLAEYLCRWQGDSLVARRPGRSLGRDPDDPPTDDAAPPPAEFPLRVAFRPAPGSLPPLRYGRRYRLRAYATFVGGAGLPYDPDDVSGSVAKATPEFTYARVEPVPAPLVLLRSPLTTGETVHRLVIRTDYDAPVPAAPAERHLVPPKIAQLDAEQHGQFDGPGGLTPGVYALLAARSDGTVTDAPYDTDTLAFPVENGATARVPYLPDPFSRRAALSGLPGTLAGSTFPVDFAGSGWPDVQPFRLRLTEGSGAPVWPVPSEPRVLQVALGKGDVVDVSLSSGLDPADLRAMEVWRWVEYGPALPPAELEARRTEAREGRNWLLTPSTRLRLICAVRRPLTAPTFAGPTATRAGLGETAATLVDTLTISRKSTVGLDVGAQWTDVTDTVDGPTWTPAKPVSKTADLGEIPVDEAGAPTQQPLSLRHEFGDTRYHEVTYTASAKSRFAEYFVETGTATLTGPVTLDSRGVAPNSEEIRSHDGATLYARDTDYTLDYPTGVLTRLAGGAIPAGATVQTRHVPTVSRPGPGVTLPVLSSARPAAPRPRYAVPTFGWEVQSPSTDPVVPPATVLSRRFGNGLRVYLERPWWSSGNGELLAVVVSSAPGVSERVRPYVTQWGGDPVFRAAPPATDLPSVAQFPQRVSTPGTVTLAEVPGALVAIAPHTVAPDVARRLWYCDIELTPGAAYTPFVRLALARYQPKSLAGAELSPVVLTDFVQLAPDRWVTLNYPTALVVAVVVVGHSYLKSAGNPTAYGRVVVTVERRDPAIPGELGWYPAGEFPLSPGVGWQQGRTMWSGQMPLPVARGTEPMRLVVREYERLSASALGDRVVFTDVVAVN